jgi:hypothetical protein
MHKVARKNRKRIIITALASVAVLLLLAPTYRLACGIGLKKVYSDNGITIYADGVEHTEKAKQMAETLRSQLLEVDSNYSPKISFYFCRTIIGFQIKAIAIGKPLALSRTGLKATFFRPCDWAKNSIEPRKPELLPRSLSSVLLHEALHHYEREKLGAVRFFIKMRTENWKIEGFCEYHSASSSFPTDKGLRIFSGYDNYDFVTNNEIKPEYFYFVSRLRTDYLLNFKKVGKDDYWSTKYEEDQLDEEIRQALKENRYTFSVQ